MRKETIYSLILIFLLIHINGLSLSYANKLILNNLRYTSVTKLDMNKSISSSIYTGSKNILPENILKEAAKALNFSHPLISQSDAKEDLNQIQTIHTKALWNFSTDVRIITDIKSENELTTSLYEKSTYEVENNHTYTIQTKNTKQNISTEIVERPIYMYGTALYVVPDDTSISSTEVDDNLIPAPPQIVKEAHWFPKQSHAKLIYKIVASDWSTLHVKLQSDQDIYARYFRVYLGSLKVFEQIVYPGRTYDFTIGLPTGASGFYTFHDLTLEIYSGGYTEFGWKITSLWLQGPAAVIGEYFPRLSKAKLSWEVIYGPDTKLDFSIKRVNDKYSRYFTVYVDDQIVKDYTVYNQKQDTLSLGNYDKKSHHIVTLEIWSGSYVEKGWILELFRVHYAALFVEIDYMPGHKPHEETLNYISEYYINHGYERVKFVVDDEVPADDTISDYNEFYNEYIKKYFDHLGKAKWKYCLFGQYYSIKDYLGVTFAKKYIFIADQACDNFANNWFNHYIGGVTEVQVEKVVLMHEVGHTVHIGDFEDSTEIYCSNSFCVMAKVNWDNCDDSPYYCAHHWSQRKFP